MSAKARREEFSRSVLNAFFGLLLASVVLFSIAVGYLFTNGITATFFLLDYPLALSFAVAALTFYITYRSDKLIHEHLDEIQHPKP